MKGDNSAHDQAVVPTNSRGATDGDYVVVARRYRPQTFAELIGQQHVAKALEGAISSNRVGHAYLFTGARGVGKTSAARILAKALECVDGPSPTPCNQCEICESISTGDDVDVLEIDGASNRGIDEIRQLRSNVNVRPSRARFKIYIIDEVHMLTREAFNALLKTLEEPPEHVKFIFCTTEPNKIPITVLSRCQRFDFAGIQVGSIVERLAQIVEAEGISADREALEILARRAAGSMRDSQSLLEQLLSCGEQHISVAEVQSLLGTADSARLLALAGHVAAGNAAGALSELDRALAEGVDVGQLLEQLLGVFRDCMVSLAGCDSDAFLYSLSAGDHASVQELAGQLGLQATLALLQVIEQAAGSLRYTTQRRTVAEVALVRACHLEDLDQLSDLLAEMRSGSEGGQREVKLAASAGTLGPRKKKSESAGIDRTSKASVTSDTPRSMAAARTSQTAAPQKPAARQQPDEQVAARTRSDERASDKQAATDLVAGQPEAAEPAASDSPAVTSPISETDARQIWEQALGKLSGIVTAKACQYNQLSMPAPNRLVVSFPESYNLCKSYCERPDQVEKIERALQEVTGKKVHVIFLLSEDAATDARPAPKKPVSRQQQMAAASTNQLVRRAGELFGARPIDINRPR